MVLWQQKYFFSLEKTTFNINNNFYSFQVVLKGAFVCAYVGERITEEDLEKHEEKKLNLLKLRLDSDNTMIEEINDSNSQQEGNDDNNEDEEAAEFKGYITYTFQIHDGTDVVNIDSE